jgi:hypothetical protein
MSSKYKNIFLFILLFVIIAAGYAYFSGGDEGDILVSSNPSGTVTEAGRELLQLGATLRAIELDDSIFSDPAFQSLEDFGQELTPEPVGRQNPFAPLGAGGSGQ